MAATGFTPISLYYSSTASAVPLAANLANGELALNTADMKLYAKNSAGTVTLLAANSSTGATVSSVAMSVPAFLSVSGSPVTTTGTLAVTLSGTALPAANGGTSQTTYATGDILYASAANTLSKLTAGTNGFVLTLAGGVPTWAASTGGVTSFSAGTTGLTPSTGTTGAITLAGTLGVANGGTGLFSTPINGQIDIGNGTNFTRATLTAGSGISITNGVGSITIASSGGSAGSGGNIFLATNFGGF